MHMFSAAWPLAWLISWLPLPLLWSPLPLSRFYRANCAQCGGALTLTPCALKFADMAQEYVYADTQNPFPDEWDVAAQHRDGYIGPAPEYQSGGYYDVRRCSSSTFTHSVLFFPRRPGNG